ncbi:RCC1 domain-containing protein [Aquipuribacter sp. SD81]|uniref:RCC1 domain-containing protein n=1 Tax=Aquipuribacter sp. SD81 TaxID=3127703 RepID=UPI0030162E15
MSSDLGDLTIDSEGGLWWRDGADEPRRLTDTGVVQVATDSSTAAYRTTAGAVLVWGDSSAGQSGQVLDLPVADPRRVIDAGGDPLGDVVDVAVDGRTLAAVTGAGTVLVWGDGRSGQLGPGRDPVAGAAPAPVLAADGRPLTDVVDVAVGGQHVLALTADGRVLSWGSDSHGQLGRVGGQDRDGDAVPRQVPLPGTVTGVAANELDSYATLADGTVMAWGNAESGQTGTDAVDTVLAVPQQVVGAEDVECVVAGEAFAAALTFDGRVLTWGAGGAGQLAAADERQRRTAGLALGDDAAPVTGVAWLGSGGRVLFAGVTG